jgi:hypothetical protein
MTTHLRRHALLCDAISLLTRAGATEIKHRVGGKHFILSARAPHTGRPLLVVISQTPSHHNAARHNAAVVKRALRRAAERRVS